MEMQKISGFVIKDCLTEASLGWKYFGTYNKDREFYTLNDKYVGDFIRKSVRGGRCGAYFKNFESSQCEEVLNKMKNI